MAAKSSLQGVEIRRQTHYAYFHVPTHLQPAVGRKRLRKTLGTRDPDKAARLKHAVHAELQRQLDCAAAGVDGRGMGPELEMAAALRADLEAAQEADIAADNHDHPSLNASAVEDEIER